MLSRGEIRSRQRRDTAPGHGEGCNGLLHAHIERLANDAAQSRAERDLFRVVIRCRCGLSSRVVSKPYARYETAESVRRQVDFRR